MYGAPPSGGQQIPPGQAAGQADPGLADAVRLQRRRHAWALALIWLTGAFLMLAAAALAVVALAIVIGYTSAMSRHPVEVRKQASALERQRLRVSWRHSWRRRAALILHGLALWLGMAMFLGGAILGVPWAINGAAYLAGAGRAVTWATPPIHDDGDAATSLIVGLLFVFGGVLVVLFICRRATRVWWPRYLQRQAGG
jgi:hypothetical protein